MSSKLLWLGLTIILTGSSLTLVPAIIVVGAWIMILGCILMLLDK